MKEKLLFGLLVIGVILASGCTTQVSTFTITDAKMCTGIDEDKNPIGIATTFSVTEPEINVWYSWAHAPSDTKLRAIWLYTTGNITIIESPEITLPDISGKGNFNITKPTGDWPVGDYKVDIYANDNLVRSVSFKVE